jgi:predicted dehydrogenase
MKRAFKTSPIVLALLVPALPLAAEDLKIVVVDPVHFHASLLQKDMYAGVSKRATVYAPLGAELLDYLNRISLFNTRAEDPTTWELDIRTSPDFFARMLQERPGNVVVLSGHNRTKIDRIQATVNAGMHLLADKPWIISSSGLSRLEQTLGEAERKGVVAYDIMTERYEITSILQRELVNDSAVFGKLLPGTPEEPGIKARSVHNVMKLVAGVPIRRPAWFFDVEEYGEGLADVGTHVVDLVQWTAFPETMLDYRKDIRVLAGRHWPTIISRENFRRVTGGADFPASITRFVHKGMLDYFCNNHVHYTLRGVHVKLDILWDWAAPPGAGDSYEAVYRGSRARVEIRQGKAEKFVPEVYVVPNNRAAAAEVAAAVGRRLAGLQHAWPGAGMEEGNGEIRILIPVKFRVGHEAHFAQVTNQFFKFLKNPRSLPAWEKAFMLAKYFVSTNGVEAGR